MGHPWRAFTKNWDYNLYVTNADFENLTSLNDRARSFFAISH